MLINLRLIHIKLNTDSNKYDGRSFKKLEEADIEDIFLLPENAYPAEFKVMTNGEEILLSRAHFRFEGQEYFAAFRVLDEQGQDCSDGFRMFYIQNEARVPMHYDATRKLFYDMPKIKGVIEKNTRFFKYANSLKDGALGSIFAGDSDLFVESIDATKCLSFKLRVLPSSMSEESYRYMINDLINIKLDLLSSKERESKQYVGIKSIQKSNSDIDEKIIRLKEICCEINNNPYTNLKYGIGKLEVNRIKRFNTRTICSFLKNPVGGKLLVLQQNETLNIYEHRAIKNRLMSIKNILPTYLFNKISNIKNQCLVNLNRLYNLMNNYGFLPNQNGYNATKDFFSKIEMESKAKKSFFFEKMIALFKERKEKSPNKEEFGEEILKVGGNLRFKKHKLYFQNKVLCSEHICNHNPKIILRFCSTDLHKHVLFWKVMTLEEDKEISLYLRKCKHQIINRDMTTATDFCTINDFEINDDLFSQDSSLPENTLNEYFSKYGDIANIEYDGKQFFQLTERINRLKDVIHGSCNEKKKKEIEQVLDEILSLNFLKFSSLEATDLHQTQIFDNDSRYRTLFEILKSLDDLLELDLYNNSEKILIKETHKLYEYWLLAKMVHTLIIEQDWNTKEVFVNGNSILPIDNSSIIKAIGKALSLETSRGSANNWISVVLNHACGMEINIQFNTKLEGTHLTPDYFIDVNDRTRWKTGSFILDAKYRDYYDMGQNAFYRDIKEVCVDKYLKRLNSDWKACGKKNSVAFIVSNGSREEKESIISKWNYWGGITDKRIEENRCGNPEHRYGSFVCCPGVESNSLKKFFEMIFEYHMLRWDVCWNCGHVLKNGIEKIIKNPNSGRANIFHCTCTECNEFWVKSYCAGGDADLLVKHYDNYHTEVDDGYHWYVECPKCGHF